MKPPGWGGFVALLLMLVLAVPIGIDFAAAAFLLWHAEDFIEGEAYTGGLLREANSQLRDARCSKLRHSNINAIAKRGESRVVETCNIDHALAHKLADAVLQCQKLLDHVF